MLTSTLPRWEGDSEPRFVLDLARCLQADFDVELLAPHAPGAARAEVLDGVHVTRFRYWFEKRQSVAYEGGIAWRLKERPMRIIQLPCFMLSLWWHVRRRVQRDPTIALIHAHWLIPQGIVAVLAKVFGRRVPIVTTSHGGDLFGLKGRLWDQIKRKVLRASDMVTVVSRAMAEAVEKLDGNIAPHVIPMGTDLRTLFVPPAGRRSSPIRRLIFVGRLVEKKGVKHLLDAMGNIIARNPSIHLDIIGHGPLRNTLEGQAQRIGLGDHVSFIGPVQYEKLPDHYRKAQLAVFPFVEAASGDQEGFGLVMVEAMGCGCAVIAAALPAVRDVLEDGMTGILVPPADIGALAEAMEDAIGNPGRTFEIANRGRAYAEKHFDWTVSGAKFKELYESLLPADG